MFVGVRPHTLQIVSLLMIGSVAACDRPPTPDGLVEWRPTDHDHNEENARLRAGVQSTGGPGENDTTLIEITWSQSCAQCHGPYGLGDGPNGPTVKTPDLTREDWQARVTDAEIEERIKTGKGSMPKFDLPPAVVSGLVARIRSYRGAKDLP